MRDCIFLEKLLNLTDWYKLRFWKFLKSWFRQRLGDEKSWISFFLLEIIESRSQIKGWSNPSYGFFPRWNANTKLNSAKWAIVRSLVLAYFCMLREWSSSNIHACKQVLEHNFRLEIHESLTLDAGNHPLTLFNHLIK